MFSKKLLRGQNLWVGFAILFAYSLILTRCLQITNIDDFSGGGGRTQIRGDAYTEKYAYNAIHYFYDHGFLKTSLLPNTNYNETGPADFLPGEIYKHYPSLPEVLGGVYAKFFNSVDLRVIRLTPVLLSILWLFVIYLFLKEIFTEKKYIKTTLILIVLSNYFIAWADNIHKFMYEELLKTSSILFLIWYYKKKVPPFLFIPCFFIISLVLSNISLDAMPTTGVLIFAVSLFYTKKIINMPSVLAFSTYLLGIYLHVLQIFFFFGSWEETIYDIKSTFLFRSIGDSENSPVEVNLLSILQHILFHNINRLERYFIIPGWGMVIMLIWVYRSKRLDFKLRSLWNYLLFGSIAAGVIWSLLMSQHAMIHVWVARNYGIFYMVAGGYLLTEYFTFLKENYRKLETKLKAMNIIFVAYMVLIFISQHVYELYFKYGFLFEYHG